MVGADFVHNSAFFFFFFFLKLPQRRVPIDFTYKCHTSFSKMQPNCRLRLVF